MPPAYVLDANVFINSHQCQYGMDFCPAFWDWLTARNKAGRIFSIDSVRAELEECDDELCDWAKRQGDEFFLPFDQDASNQLARVMAWVEDQSRFKRSAKDLFGTGADMFLIAYALAHAHIIVTHELPAPKSKTKVKIPDVCDGLGVQYISLWALLRAEGAKFVMDS
jgi:hypothetical protein